MSEVIRLFEQVGGAQWRAHLLLGGEIVIAGIVMLVLLLVAYIALTRRS